MKTSFAILYLLHLLMLSMDKVCASEPRQKSDFLQDTLQIQMDHDMSLFDGEEPLDITFMFNIRDFMRGRYNQEYLDATMTVQMPSYDPIVQHIRIRARGNFRRSICSFPPILINPGKHDSTLQLITNNRNIKLVTHCRNSSFYEDFVLKEYLVYKLYNLLTDYSFRVRLAKINYVDEDNPDDTIFRFGFFIENIEDLAERNNAVVLENDLLKQDDMIPLLMARMSVFEYMIGNLDWQLGRAHNMETIKALDIFTDKAIPVPYDFDFSGLVDASYAITREDLGQKYIEQRVFLGICSHQDQWSAVLNTFEDLKDGFYETVNNFEFIDAKNKERIISYLDQFYLLAEDREAFLIRLQNECREQQNIINIIR